MAKMQTSQGEVPIKLNGAQVVLRSSLEAAKAVNFAFGGFSPAFRQIVENDLRAFAIIIAAGIGGKTPEDVENDVYKTGLASLAKPVAKFLGYLSNGGRDPSEKKENEPGEE
jgi:hypothetical protein